MLNLPRNVWAAIPSENSDEFRDKAIYTLGLTSWHNWLPNGKVPTARALYHAMPIPTPEHPLWLAFVEPERAEQDNLPARQAAEMTAAWPPSMMASVALPGILLSAAGYQWLETYLLLGGMAPDVWSVHLYALDPAHGLHLWQEWQRWLIGHELPTATILSEFGCWTEGQSEGVLRTGFELLRTDQNLVAAYWFSVHFGSFDPFYLRMDLLDAAGNLTELGRQYLLLRYTVQPAERPPWVLSGDGKTILLPVVRT